MFSLSFCIDQLLILGELPINHQIVYELQDVLNLLPDVNFGEFVKSYEIQTNDEMAVVYLATVIRTIVSLHNLINNKIHNRNLEENKKETKDDKKSGTTDKDKDQKTSGTGDKKEEGKSDKEKAATEKDKTTSKK